MYAPSNAIAEFNFRIAHAVSADHRTSGLDHLGKSPGKDALENCCISVLGKTDHRQCVEWSSTHGVDVAQRIYCCDLSEGERIVHDGGEEIYGLHQRQIV